LLEDDSCLVALSADLEALAESDAELREACIVALVPVLQGCSVVADGLRQRA
jgi:hypothetical protein